MARSMPAVLRIFLRVSTVLNQRNANYAADALYEISQREPELLDRAEMTKEAARLSNEGDKDALRLITKALSNVLRASPVEGYKYGI
jgi:hypothetical protein